MLLQETKDYVNNVVLPECMDGYNDGNTLAFDILEDIEFLGEGTFLREPTRLAKNIAANREEFTAYVVKAFQDLEAGE